MKTIYPNIQEAQKELPTYYHVVSSNEVHSFQTIEEAQEDLIIATNAELIIESGFAPELITPPTYDIVFNSDTSSQNLGFKASVEYCKDYIAMHNGSNHSYFEDYKGGSVSIVCNETEEIVFETEVKIRLC